MNGIFVLIPIALLLGLAGLAAFFWALRAGQFDDLDGAALRILIDDEQKNGADRQDPPQVEELVAAAVTAGSRCRPRTRTDQD